MAEGPVPVLDVKGLRTIFRTRGGEIHAVNDVSFHLDRGELLGVVGESGSGKSVTCRALLGLLPRRATIGGHIRYDGKDLADPAAMQAARGREI
jgi:peptide/nickel transport system ATP-binding protein/oligopeptide transport system ATP-binding protein